MSTLIGRSSIGGRLSVTMRPLLAICLGAAGACAVLLLGSVAADVVGGAVAIGALVAITRSVIRLAGDAGTPRDASVSSSSGSSREATSRFRSDSRPRSPRRAPQRDP
jgi:hypothetical protein